LGILERKTIAIIGSRSAGEESLAFTRAVSGYLAEHGANVISGNARGVDRTAYEGATGRDGHTTVVLPHGIRKLSGVQMRALVPKIEAGHVLLMSQFHPDAQWVVSRAMERNKVVTGLAQIVIVAEADVQGGTWAGANGALKQHRPLYVRQVDSATSLPGNKALIELGGHPLSWPAENIADVLSPLLEESAELLQEKKGASPPPDQLSLFAATNDV
jgi:DNA processing protein